jgi:hypothetical protein
MQATKLCPPPHLEAADLCGKDVTVTIKEVGFSLVGTEQKNKGVLMYQEFDRGMVINRTNLKRIIAMYGNETDAWKGKRVTLYESEADFNGQTVPCIRIREKKPE